MTATDIAYLRKIKGGLSAVTDANKDAIKDSLSQHIDTLKEIKQEDDGVKFSGLKNMESNQALRLMRTNVVVYKDSNGMYIPLEVKSSRKIDIVPEMYRDEHFKDAMNYVPKTKDALIKKIKNKIQNSDEIKRELKAEGWSMTKVFKLSSLGEQNDVLKKFGIYDIDNILENFNVEKQHTFRLKKIELNDKWPEDNITKNIQKQYEELKLKLMSESSASEVFALSKKILNEIEIVLENNPLDSLMKKDKRVVDFFNVGNKEVLIPKEEIGEMNFNPAYHESIITRSAAIEVVKKYNLQEKYPIKEEDNLSIFLPASNVEDLKFGLMDYLTYQVNMKNEYKMMMQASEKDNKPTMGY